MKNMIDLTRIRSVKTLTNMKKDLEFFINEPIVLEIYKNEYNWDDVDYEADVESATLLSCNIDKRIASLNKMKKTETTKPEKQE